MKVDSIIFDLDGTLWDSSEQVAESWNIVLKQHGINIVLNKQDIMGAMGMLMKDIVRKLLPNEEESVRLDVLNDICSYGSEYISKTGGILFSNVEKTLKELSKQYKLAIVSNCQAGYIEAFFKAHNLDKYFVDYENPGRTGLDKAGNISLVVERNGFLHPIYVGDTLGDQLSAKKAGVPFIFASYGFGEVNEYEGKITSFEELPRLLQQ